MLSGSALVVGEHPKVSGALSAALRSEGMNVVTASSAIERALRHAKGNRTLAARLLGVGRATLYVKLEEHGLAKRSG